MRVKLSLFLKILLSFVVSTLIPVIILGYYSINKTSINAQQAALQTNLFISKQTEQQSEVFLSDVEQTLQTIVKNLQLNSPSNTNQILDFYQQNYALVNTPVFNSFILLNKNGTVVTVSPYNKSFINYDYSNQDAYRQVIQTKSPYYAPAVEVSPVTPAPTIRVAVPDIVNGQIEYILIADVNLQAVSNFNNQTKVGQSGFAFIIDKNGTFVAHPDKDYVNEQQNISNIYNGLERSSFDSQKAIYWPKDNPQLLLTSYPLAKTGWTVIFAQNESEIFQVTTTLRNQLILTFLLTLVFMNIVTFFLSRQITHPLNKLKNAMESIITHGLFKSRVAVLTGDEIEDLGNSFNNMAQRLEQNINQLTSQNRLVSALQSIDRVSLSTRDVLKVCQGIVSLVTDSLGYSFGAIALIDKNSKTLKMVSRSAKFDPGEILDKVLGIQFNQQSISLLQSNNLLIRSIDGRQSFYTEDLSEVYYGLVDKPKTADLQTQLNLQTILVYPIIAQDQILGVIYYISPLKKDQIAPIEYSLLREYTSEAGRAIENTLLYENLRTDRELISGERNKLAVTLSGITDAVIALDLEGKIITANKAAQGLTGMDSNDMLGQQIDKIIHLFDEDKKVTFYDYCPVKDDNFEGIVYSKQNLKLISTKEVYVNITVGQIKNRAKANLAGIITFQDLTKEKQLEEMKLDFVSMAAHELRTPLTSIKNYLYVYLRNYHQTLNPEQHTFLTRMNIATQRLNALVENLLNVTKIEKGVLSLRFENVDWIENSKELVDELSDQSKDKQIMVEFVKPREVYPQITIDKFRINEVLTNLLSNAISYSRIGGKVKIWFEKNDKEIITHIEDNGPGIPSEALPHLFTKFFRVSGKLEQGSKGTGLGLYISKSIVEMHKGKIWVVSSLGKGSIFSFALPINQSHVPTTHLTPHAYSQSLTGVS